ncbi:MAG TPA: LysM peptidoglycan-binding domain-containing protein [Candidatus Saccharimonadales bacterium]|nr:LysM peptidoglycan-binding domain-containing protein [Candidatus Saccharimonadales bacterium]
MMRLRGIAQCAILLLLLGCVGGCLPGDNHLDEEKDPHFQRGRNLVSSQDFKGAVDEFEKALETNPRSAAAHFELGWLYDTKINDYAAAIYHYQKHLQLQPDSERASLVKERIRGCKQELANTEFPLPNNQNLQREVDRLNAENMALRQQVDSLRNRVSAAPLPTPIPSPAPAPAQPVHYAAAPTPRLETPHAAGSFPPPRPRVHIVKSRETITSIAARYGVKPGVILSLNPHTDPRHLRVGQSLNLP